MKQFEHVFFQHSRNVLRRPHRHIRNDPTGLTLCHRVLTGIRQQRLKGVETVCVDDGGNVMGGPSAQIADDAHDRDADRGLLVHYELHETIATDVVHDQLESPFVPIGDVRQGPHGV